MFFIIQANVLPYFWLILAVIFLFAEIGTPGLFFFIAFSIGFFITAIAAFLGVSFFAQCWASLVFSILAFIVLRHYFVVKKAEKEITNTDALIGRKGVVLVEIKPNKKGQVKIGGETWSAISYDDIVLEKNTIIKVVKVIGNKLVVNPSIHSASQNTQGERSK